MKTIVCFGDSNTWGWNPATKERHARSARWTGVLQDSLGPDFTVIEEGLCSRTTVWEDPIERHRNGSAQLLPCLESHHPLDLVVLMLGTNDLKNRFSVSAYDVANGIAHLLRIIRNSECGPAGRAPAVLLLCPPPIGKLGEWKDAFIGAEAKSCQLAPHYATVARQSACHFLDTGKIIVSSDLDGVHLEASEHKKLGEAVAAAVRQIFTPAAD